MHDAADPEAPTDDVPSDNLVAASQAIAAAVRFNLKSPKCHLMPRLDLAPQMAAIAGVAHSARILERLAAECEGGDEFVVRLIARHHLEAVVTTLYLAYGGQDALKRLMAADKCHFERQAGVLEGNNKRIAKARKTVRKRNDKIRAKNEQRRSHFGPGALGLIEEYAMATAEPIELDAWNYVLEAADEIEASDLTFDELVKAFISVAPWGDESVRDDLEGSNTVYNIVYRSLSNLGAHVNLWTFERYLDTTCLTVGVNPVASMPSMAEGSLHSAAVWTAWAAQVVFDARGLDTEAYDDLLTSLGVAGHASPVDS